MAAFSAVISLEQLLNSDQLPMEEIVSLRGQISSLKTSLENIFPAPKKDRNEANKLAIRIREKMFEAQDTIESFIFFTQNHPPETSKLHQSLTSISLQEIIAGIDPIIEEAKKLDDSIARGRNYPRPVAESRTIESILIGLRSKIVGQEKYKSRIEKWLTKTTGSLLVIPISGMPGIGKTTLAKSIYEDVQIMKNFPYKAWVTVTLEHNIQDVLGKLLHTLESRGQKAGDEKYEGDDEAKLRVELYQALYNKKYLVVIDDLWHQDIWERLKIAFPDNENSSRILVTTRILKVADAVKSMEGFEMETLGIEESWNFLRYKTFGDNTPCPTELENCGRRIASHCHGLPLSLSVIGGILSRGRKDIEYWQSVEEDTKTYTYDEKFSQEIFSLSYDILPSKLKGCFLYMAAFPEDVDIPVLKLIRLWVAEGLITIPPPAPKCQLVEDVAEQSLGELIDRNLVLIRKFGSDGRISYCGMSKSLRDLAVTKSGEDMFFHIRKRHTQKLEEGTNTQRRISVHKNILMCLEDVYNSTKKIDKARSLLCVGPYHHHPMPFNLTFDLLRVLDAFTFFFIEFPHEILKLIHLRYLSFTYNGKLPSRLSRLQKLQVLIVKRQPKIIYVGAPFLPDEIWSMKELRHLLITETDLPFLSPTEPGAILLENLQTLSNVNADSCTEKVFQHTPNLKRLGMWMEGPDKVEFYMNKLDQLEIFKFTVLKPILKPSPEVQPKFYFPNTMRKLTLSGTGLPWEDMEAIAALPNLKVLKLKDLAFHGAEWCTTYKFKKLKFLLIEYLNLQIWEADSSNFPRLEQLIFRHCYDLEDLPLDIGNVENLRLIELVDCSPDAVAWAGEVIADAEDFGNTRLQVRINSSWE